MGMGGTTEVTDTSVCQSRGDDGRQTSLQSGFISAIVCVCVCLSAFV